MWPVHICGYCICCLVDLAIRKFLNYICGLHYLSIAYCCPRAKPESPNPEMTFILCCYFSRRRGEAGLEGTAGKNEEAKFPTLAWVHG